jgi:hypothetical protein
MSSNHYPRFDYSLPLVSGTGINSSPRQSQAGAAQPADFSDRQLAAYFLPHPQNPSAYLQELYAAVRKQMVLDGCD